MSKPERFCPMGHRVSRCGGPCLICSGIAGRRRVLWTAEQDEAVRKVYCGASGRAELSAGLRALSLRLGRTRKAIGFRASELGLVFTPCRPWTAGELAVLRSGAGAISVKHMTTLLPGRTYRAVRLKLKALGLRGEVREGYTQRDLERLFHVGFETVRKWISRRWLAPDPGLTTGHAVRFAEGAVLRFVRRHPEEWSLRRVDETWFKGVLFGDAACYRTERVALKDSPQVFSAERVASLRDCIRRIEELSPAGQKAQWA